MLRHVHWARRLASGALALALAVGLAAAWAGVALAHASLIRSDPAANTRLERSPDHLTIWFDEQIEPDYTFLSVFDKTSQRVDRLDARFTPGDQPSVMVSLPELPTGSYVAVWRVISLDDGHAVGGAFAFGVNAAPDPAAAATAGAQADARPDLTTFLIRFVGLLSQLLLFGAVVFRSIVWGPVLAEARRSNWLNDQAALEPEQRRWLQIFADVLVGGLITGLLGSLYVQARTTGVLFWQLLGTRWGLIWLARAAVVLLASLWMEPLLDGRRSARWCWGLSLALLLTTGLASHSAARPGVLGLAADLAHQVSAGAWAGGLVMLVLTLLILRGSSLAPQVRARLYAAAIARFSGLANLAVALLLTTGLVLGYQQVPTWAGLLLTSYGRTLLVKLALATAALALGAYNSLRAIAPALGRPTGSMGQRPAWIAAESVVVAAIVFAAAVLVDLPPATTAGTSGTALANESSAQLAVRAGQLELDTRASPGRLGSNVFELGISDDGGQPVKGAKAALHFESPDGGAASDLLLTEDRPGHYTGTGAGFSRQGAWRVTVQLALPAINAVYDVTVGLDGIVRPAGASLPLAVQAAGWLNHYGWLALALMLAALAGGWSYFFVRTRREFVRPG